VLLGASRSIVAKDRAVSGLLACNHNRKSRPPQSRSDDFSNLASKGAMTVRLLRERIRIKISRIPAHGFKVIRDHSLRYTWNCRRHAGLYRKFCASDSGSRTFPSALRKRVPAKRWQQSPPTSGRSCSRPDRDATNRTRSRPRRRQTRSEYWPHLLTNDRAKK
jgi:hypothetical protein